LENRKKKGKKDTKTKTPFERVGRKGKKLSGACWGVTKRQNLNM